MFEKEAEEYAEKYFGKKTELVEVWKLKSCKENFLAGLKAGRPQWHDLRKDPNDLPKENTEVLIYCYGNIRQAIFRGFFKSLYGDCRVEEVIAWCEIPTFDKE